MIATRRFAWAAATSLLALATFDVSPASAGKAEEADEFLTHTQRLISAIRLNPIHEADEKRALIEQLLNHRLDLPAMARLALGRRESAFSADEHRQFIEQYSRFLTYTYLREIAWSDPKELPTLESTSVDEESGWVTIRTRARLRSSMVNQRGEYRQSSVFRAEYLLSKKQGRWKITKLSFNGVDLNTSFGAQFASVLRKSTPQQLIEELRELNRKREATNPLE